MNRKYVLKLRAERQAETRRRIVEATVKLHGTVGPAQTTFSAIAALAGVQRHTVYSHFPDQDDLLAACTAHFLVQRPPPDPGTWLEIQDPVRRLRHGLSDLYAYYTANEVMIGAVLRDSEKVPVGGGFRRLQAAAVQILGDGWGPETRDSPGLLPALRLAISFASWRSLVHDSGLDSDQAAELMAAVVTCAR